MSEHLSAGQIAEWTAGERRPELDSHLRECAACRSQIEEFQTVLGQFRGSIRSWSDAQFGRVERPAWAPRSTKRVQPRLYWAAATAAFCALMAIFLFQGSVPTTRRPLLNEPHVTANHLTATDAVLMRQVDTEVSQTVPDAMEPLMGLVSWGDSSVAAEGSSGSKHSEKEEQ